MSVIKEIPGVEIFANQGGGVTIRQLHESGLVVMDVSQVDEAIRLLREAKEEAIDQLQDMGEMCNGTI